MDIGVVVGYLVAFLSGRAKRLADRVVDDLLERLYAKVVFNLRADPSIRRLENDPSDDRAQADVVKSLSAMVALNDDLAGDLHQLVSELDGRGAKKLIAAAPVHGDLFQQVTAQHGSIVGSIGRDVNIFYQGADGPEFDEQPNAGCVSRGFSVLGGLVILVGFGAFIYSILAKDPDTVLKDFPHGLELGIGLMFLGMFLVAVSGMIALLRRRINKRTDNKDGL